MKRMLRIASLFLLALALLGFEPADVIYDPCEGAPPNAVCSDYRAADAGQARNVIFMIGDGMGLNQVWAARVKANGPSKPLALETLPHHARVTTCSLTGYTDSAAAGTALATGHKAFVKDVSTSPEGEDYETLLELAQKMGKSSGLLTTVDITDATPACFGAHVPARKDRAGVADDYLNQTRPQLLMGGGRKNFSAAQIETAQGLGYAVVYDLPELKKLDPNAGGKVLGLFADEETAYEADRADADAGQPHLHEMAAFALDALEEDPDGFFLMIEGGAIDHACHAADLDKAIAETLEFDKTVQLVLDWIGDRKDTLLIITADHETGGLTIQDQPYPKGDTVKAKFTTKKMPAIPAMHSKQRVPLFAQGPNAAAVQPDLDNTAVYCIVRNALQ